MDPSATLALALVVEKGPRKGETVECKPGGRVRIGRVVKGNTFTIKDAGISQKHLSIEAAGGGRWTATDLDSSNGSLLNDVQMEPSVPADLRDGDTIKIGEETAIRIRIAEVSAPWDVAPPPRRNPRRGCVAGPSDEPQHEAGGGARGRARRARGTATKRVQAVPHPESGDVDVANVGGSDGDGEDERFKIISEENVGKQRNNTAAPRRGRGASKRAAAATSGAFDSVPDESEKEVLEAVQKTSCNIPKEVKLEVSDSVPVRNAKASKAGVRRGKGAATRATAAAGVMEEEPVRVEEKRVAALEEGEDVAGANPIVEDGGVDMENMTLEDWFDRMEKYLPKVMNEIADEIIADIKAKAERFNGYVRNSLNSEQDGSLGAM